MLPSYFSWAASPASGFRRGPPATAVSSPPTPPRVAEMASPTPSMSAAAWSSPRTESCGEARGALREVGARLVTEPAWRVVSALLTVARPRPGCPQPDSIFPVASMASPPAAAAAPGHPCRPLPDRGVRAADCPPTGVPRRCGGDPDRERSPARGYRAVGASSTLSVRPRGGHRRGHRRATARSACTHRRPGCSRRCPGATGCRSCRAASAGRQGPSLPMPGHRALPDRLPPSRPRPRHAAA